MHKFPKQFRMNQTTMIELDHPDGTQPPSAPEPPRKQMSTTWMPSDSHANPFSTHSIINRAHEGPMVADRKISKPSTRTRQTALALPRTQKLLRTALPTDRKARSCDNDRDCQASARDRASRNALFHSKEHTDASARPSLRAINACNDIYNT